MGGLSRRQFVGGAALALAGCGGRGCGPRCGGLTAEDVDRGIALAADYMVRSITTWNDFVYEVHWQTNAGHVDPNGVRQAGATWGLLDHAARSGDAAMLTAADRPFGRWLERRRITPMGTTFVWGKKDGRSHLGTAALLGMATAERARLSAPPEGLAEVLEGVIQFVRSSRLPDGGFVEEVDVNTDRREPTPSPYSDGEALLFFATLAVRHGRADLLPEVLAWAEADYRRNVEGPLAIDADPDTTKGYYQWATMSWALLVEGGHDPERWGRRMTDLATWMVDVHGTLRRTRNTAYAYEGLIPSFVEARRRGDGALADKLACTIHEGLVKLCSWQLGHPRALPALAEAPPDWLGGVQNHAEEAWLRIDVTQHQLHSLWLARESGVVDHAL